MSLCYLVNCLYVKFYLNLTLIYNSFCTTWNIFRDNLKPVGVNQKQNPIKELEAKFKQINNNNTENEEETPTFNFQVRPNNQNQLWTWQQYFLLYWALPCSHLLQFRWWLVIVGLKTIVVGFSHDLICINKAYIRTGRRCVTYLGTPNSYSAWKHYNKYQPTVKSTLTWNTDENLFVLTIIYR